MQKVDLVGKNFYSLTVISSLPNSNHGHSMWLCLCVCGNQIAKSYGKLVGGVAKSCGCIRKENIIGQKFGRWSVLESTELKDSNRGYLWLCKCDCGTIKPISGNSLRMGKTRSCGCLKKELASIQGKNRMIHGMSGTLEYSRFCNTKRRAEKLKRTPEWLTDEDWEKIRNIYKDCPENYDVDHIIPLQGKLVSGLHVPDNLKAIPKSENRKKHNSFIPQVFLSC